MAANKMNSVFQCIDQCIGHAFRRDQWQGILKERFSEIEPWLIPSGRRSETFGCARSPHCHYRIVEHADGSFVGVCDEGRCDRRPFAPEELVQYHPNFARFRLELARLLELEPDRSEPPQPNVLPIGKMTLGKDRMEVKLVGGLNPGYLPQILMRFLNVRGPRQIILLASSYDGKADLKDFVYRVGWNCYEIEHSFTLSPRSLDWSSGAQAQWLTFKRSLLPPDVAREEDGRKFLAMIEEKLALLDKGIRNLQTENTVLKEDLAGHFISIARKVEPEYFHWILAIMAAGSVSAAAGMLDVANSTFNEKLKRYRDRGGIYRTLFDLLQIRRKGLGTRKLERFNEDYMLHQRATEDSNETDLLREVIDALEAQDEATWPAIRDELLTILKEQT
jgi:hypothetical protein